MYQGTFEQTSSKIIISDPADESLGKAKKNSYATSIVANNVLKGIWNVYKSDQIGIAYIIHSDYVTKYSKFYPFDKWEHFDNTVTTWGRRIGFFDYNFYRNDESVEGEKTGNFIKSNDPGDKWYNYNYDHYWKNYTDAVMDHGCLLIMSMEDFCPADDFPCYCIKNEKNKIYGIAVQWAVL